MATKPQLTGEGFSSIAGMSKSQLYELMSQMKLLIEQNHQQAKQILIDNPTLTRALFQAQILLGMVQPTQPANIQQVLSQSQSQSQSQSAQVGQQSNVQTTQPLLVQPSHQGQTSSSQPVVSTRQQRQPQPSMSLPSVSLPSSNFQSHTTPSIPSHLAQQAKGPANAQVPSMSAPQSSQIHNLSLPPPPAPPHYSMVQSHMPTVSSQAQPSVQMPGVFNQPMQPPLPQQPRPPSMQPFSHQQHHSQMPHLGFQPNVPQQHLSQPMFHSASNLGSSFPQGQPPLPNQPPPQHLYNQGGPHIGSEYNNQVGTLMQAERGHWGPGLPERAAGGPHLPGPPPMGPGQMLPGLGGGQLPGLGGIQLPGLGGGQVPGLGGGQPPRPPPLTPEIEKALLQQVMSLTPEQINLLPPEQRQQVIQLQEMLR